MYGFDVASCIRLLNTKVLDPHCQASWNIERMTPLLCWATIEKWMVPMMSTIHFARVVLKSGRSLIKQLRMKKNLKFTPKSLPKLTLLITLLGNASRKVGNTYLSMSTCYQYIHVLSHIVNLKVSFNKIKFSYVLIINNLEVLSPLSILLPVQICNF